MSTNRSQEPRRAGRPWSGVDLMRLSALAEKQIPVDQIARRLQRSETAVKAEAARQRLKLAAAATATGKRPYGRIAARRADAGDETQERKGQGQVPERTRTRDTLF